jgi:hypothetical protein
LPPLGGACREHCGDLGDREQQHARPHAKRRREMAGRNPGVQRLPVIDEADLNQLGDAKEPPAAIGVAKEGFDVDVAHDVLICVRVTTSGNS